MHDSHIYIVLKCAVVTMERWKVAAFYAQTALTLIYIKMSYLR